MLSSSKVTSPSKRNPTTLSFIRLIVRRKVDLPQPVGPMSAVIVPRRNEIWTFERMRFWPNDNDKPFDSTTFAGRDRSGSRASRIGSTSNWFRAASDRCAGGSGKVIYTDDNQGR